MYAATRLLGCAPFDRLLSVPWLLVHLWLPAVPPVGRQSLAVPGGWWFCSAAQMSCLVSGPVEHTPCVRVAVIPAPPVPL
jgi:hypothetical protein